MNLFELSPDARLSFFLNLYNAMVIHAVIRVGRPQGVIERRSFFSEFQYLVGGHPYSLSTIENGILRNNRRPPYSLVKPFGAGDNRTEVSKIINLRFLCRIPPLSLGQYNCSGIKFSAVSLVKKINFLRFLKLFLHM